MLTHGRVSTLSQEVSSSSTWGNWPLIRFIMFETSHLLGWKLIWIDKKAASNFQRIFKSHNIAFCKTIMSAFRSGIVISTAKFCVFVTEDSTEDQRVIFLSVITFCQLNNVNLCIPRMTSRKSFSILAVYWSSIFDDASLMVNQNSWELTRLF